MKPGDYFMAPVGVVTILEVGEYVSKVSYANSLGEEMQTVWDNKLIRRWPKMGEMSGPECPESDIKKGEI